MCVHYGDSKKTDNGIELKPLVDGQELKEEWVMFRQVMFQTFKDSSLQGMAKKLFSSNEMQDQFPQVHA